MSKTSFTAFHYFFLVSPFQFQMCVAREKFLRVMLKLFLLSSFCLCGSSFELRAYEKCFSTLTQGEGVCVEPKECDHFKTYKTELHICSFVHKLPIVCCPKSGARSGVMEIRKSAVSEFCVVENIKIQIVIQTSYLRVRRVFKSFQNRSLPDSRFCRRCNN